MSTPETMRVFKCKGAKQAGVVEAPLPAMRPDYVLVKVSCVALNPTDWKHIDSIPTENATIGCDYSGTVVAVGPSVTKPFKPGDRIAGFTHGCNAVQPEDGSFGEYCVAKGDLQMAVPANLTDEAAATFGVAITTVGQSMYQRMGLPLPTAPTSDQTPLLVYGGSTTTGLAAIQFARLSGLTPIATCSPRNAELVKAYGAAAAFDYADPEACAAQIREYTADGLLYALDCISLPASAQICAGALSSRGGATYCSLLPVELPRKDIESGYTLGYTAMGERFTFRGGKEFAAKAEDFDYAVRFWRMADRLLEEGRLVAPPIERREGGLDGIAAGLDDFRAGKVSGSKLVYRL